jgi:hypothetical protein
MGHIRYNGMTFDLPGDRFEVIKEVVGKALDAGKVAKISIPDSDGDTSYLLIAPGSSVSFHTWDAPTLGS